jgi:hypothetical protein
VERYRIEDDDLCLEAIMEARRLEEIDRQRKLVHDLIEELGLLHDQEEPFVAPPRSSIEIAASFTH